MPCKTNWLGNTALDQLCFPYPANPHEYRHNPALISSQTRVYALHYRCWQYGSIFNQILMMGSERQAYIVTEWIIALQGHRFWYQSKAHVHIPIPTYSIATWTLSCTVSEIQWLKCWKLTIFPTPLLFQLKFVGVPFGVDPWCWGLQTEERLS